MHDCSVRPYTWSQALVLAGAHSYIVIDVLIPPLKSVKCLFDITICNQYRTFQIYRVNHQPLQAEDKKIVSNIFSSTSFYHFLIMPTSSMGKDRGVLSIYGHVR